MLLLHWMFISFSILLASSHAVRSADLLDKRSLEEILNSKCPQQCDGEIYNVYLEKMCTCVFRSGTFLYGKRGSSTTSAEGQHRRQVGLEDKNILELSKLLAASAVPPHTNEVVKSSPISTSDVKKLEDILSRKSKLATRYVEPLEQQRSVLHSESTARSPQDTSDDKYDRVLKDLLSSVDLRESERGVKERTTQLETTTDLFKSEIGKDAESATKEDYLKWVEKQMSISEQRLEKLIKFYKLIKLTSDA